MISKNKNFLFIHVPKTGGNSIQNILIKYSDDNIVLKNNLQDGTERFELDHNELGTHKHSTLSEYKSKLDTTVYKKLYKFSVIRNPFERLVSFYFSPHRKVSVWNRDDFISLINDEVQPLSYYIRTKEKTLKNLIFNNNAIDTELDFLIRFENLNDDFDEVCQKLEIKHDGLPHRNKSKREDYKKYYDSELEDLVKRKFSEEIEYGNYSI